MMRNRMLFWVILFLLPALAFAKSQRALGSIESKGQVRVGGIVVPEETVLLSNSKVETDNGAASIQYLHGPRVVLASRSVGFFTGEEAHLEKGTMIFNTAFGGGVSFFVSTLRLEPVTGRTTANATFSDGKASIAVTEGLLRVIDPSKNILASLAAGEQRLFEEDRPLFEEYRSAPAIEVPRPLPEMVIEKMTIQVKKGSGVVDRLKDPRELKIFADTYMVGVSRLEIREGRKKIVLVYGAIQ